MEKKTLIVCCAIGLIASFGLGPTLAPIVFTLLAGLIVAAVMMPLITFSVTLIWNFIFEPIHKRLPDGNAKTIFRFFFAPPS